MLRSLIESELVELQNQEDWDGSIPRSSMRVLNRRRHLALAGAAKTTLSPLQGKSLPSLLEVENGHLLKEERLGYWEAGHWHLRHRDDHEPIRQGH